MPTSREKGIAIAERRHTGGPAFWTGHPNDATVPLYAEAWGLEPVHEAIYAYLGDDCRWVPADTDYRHPEGYPMWDMSGVDCTVGRNMTGPLAAAETIADIDRYPWPDARWFNFAHTYEALERFPDKLCFTGVNAMFFHIVSDLFGMENYFIKMFECPEVVEAATERIVDFYLEANERFFSGLNNRADVFFFGNDFGTQLDLFVSPDQFRRFILPSFKRLIALAKKHGIKTMLHSCGSVYRIIPDLIDAGVDFLHPLQAQAAGMSADALKQFKHDIAFVGGIDAQSFLVDAPPDAVARETERVWETLGPNIILSPSHEEILPNVPAANILSVSRTVRRLNGEYAD